MRKTTNNACPTHAMIIYKQRATHTTDQPQSVPTYANP